MLSPEQIENRKRWIAALRSDKYKQCRGSLRSIYGYCCLGVSCDISKLSKWSRWFKTNFFHYSGDINMLPTIVSEFYGVSSDEQDELMIANDSGKTFEEIATMIERRTN